jgi:hypothetical protein
MDANQRSEVNNQTNNGANEKWTPGSTGASGENGQPLDHTYPQGLGVQQQGSQQRDMMGTQQGGAGAGGMGGQENGEDAGIPGGSMETQINGGSGAVQGITDSHQRQMEPKSGAYGLLEQPVGHRRKDTGVNLNQQRNMQSNNMQSNTQGGGMAGPLSSLPRNAPAGSMGNRQAGTQPPTQGGGMSGPRADAQSDPLGGQEAQQGNMQQGVAGSHSGANQQSDHGGVHESNDVAGGLPRSPGNAGAARSSTDRAGSQTGAGGAEGGPDVHKSNDAAGGYPRSPGYANRLAGDSNMDDDTGFKRKP